MNECWSAVCKVSWSNKTNVHSFGAELFKDGVTSAADCLDVCVTTASCVAVEVDFKYWPVRCWVHDDPYKLTYTAPLHHVVQYRVLARHCYDTAGFGTVFTFYSYSNLLFVR